MAQQDPTADAMDAPAFRWSDTRAARESGGFAAGTLVLTAEGPRPIDSIRVGDLVLSRPDSGTRMTAYKRVLKTLERDEQALWLISFARTQRSSGGGSNEHAHGYVVSTGSQTFWITGVAPDQQSFFDSDWDYLGDESTPLVPNEWRRADRLTPFMGLAVATGADAYVLDARRIYRTSDASRGWVWDWSAEHSDFHEGYDIVLGPKGPECRILQRVRTGMPADVDLDAADDSGLYTGKAYDLEVEDFHAYFVDDLGIRVGGPTTRSHDSA